MSELFKDEFESQSVRELYRKMKKTAKARFNFARRLQSQHNLTAWTLSLFSAGLLIISTAKEFGVPISVEDAWFKFIQFTLGIVILVISLLLNSSRSSERSETMHRCALEINQLVHELLPSCKDESNEEIYEKIQFRYSNILNTYENHEPIDFQRVMLDYPDHYGITKKFRVYYNIRYILGFSVQIALILLLLATAIITFL